MSCPSYFPIPPASSKSTWDSLKFASFPREKHVIDCYRITLFAGTLSKFGAGLFLLVQVIILLDATHSWNDAWVAKDEQKWFVQFLYFIDIPVVDSIWLIATFGVFQVLCSTRCISYMLYCSIYNNRCSVYLVQSFWLRLRTQRVLSCDDHDSCACIWCYCIAPSGKWNI